MKTKTCDNAMGRCRPERGFTLIEMLVTLLLMAIIMPTAMRAISQVTRMADYSRRQIEAAALARTKLSEMVASGEWSGGTRRGTFGNDFPDYEWSWELTDWEVDPLEELTVRVSWDPRFPEERSVTVSTLVYQSGE